MSQHPSEAELATFVEGDLPTDDAVRLAEHLDSCPHCAAIAATLEPLSPAFARCEDPVPPDDLGEAVFAALDAPAPRAVETVVGVGLLAAGGALSMVTGHPVAWLADLEAWWRFSLALTHAAHDALSPALIGAVAAGFLIAGALTWRSLTLRARP